MTSSNLRSTSSTTGATGWRKPFSGGSCVRSHGCLGRLSTHAAGCTATGFSGTSRWAAWWSWWETSPSAGPARPPWWRSLPAPCRTVAARWRSSLAATVASPSASTRSSGAGSRTTSRLRPKSSATARTSCWARGRPGTSRTLLACNLPGVVVVVDKNRVKAGEYAIRKFGCDHAHPRRRVSVPAPARPA